MTAPRVLADLTWEDVRDLDRPRTVAVLPVGAIEAHGPHLPLATDVVIATALVLPALPFTAAPFGANFPGTLSVSAGAVTALILDLARELTRQQFAALAIANAHLDPAHLAALQAVVNDARDADLLPVAFPDLSRKPWAPRLTEEFRTGACHAGRYEGSVVLAERPDLVRNDVLASLPPNPASLSTAIREGARSFEQAGGARAYFGWPADATAAEGRETIETLGAILADAVAEALAPARGKV
jgi:creatinine amidohydrolase